MDVQDNFFLVGLLSGLGVTLAGVTLQLIGHFLFRWFGDEDTKDVAGVAGFRVAAIFGIACGLIFAASAAYLIEAKRDLQEEARLIGTLQFLVANADGLENKLEVHKNLNAFAERSLKEFQTREGVGSAGRVTSNYLGESCRGMVPAEGDEPAIAWAKGEFQRSCSKLIDLRGKKLIGSREPLVSTPFWAFFGICFAFLAFLFGVFKLTPINVAFACIFYFTTGITGSIIYAMSNPYREPGRVDPQPLILLLQGADAAREAE
ncbi:MAG: hypothetical protein QNJ62_09230 [Methyloceanibacter sp.]|nr:hypothetical protein [Methyloceanibacter sp.]